MSEIILTAVIFFTLGVSVGLWIATLYPKREDRMFREYLKREYGQDAKHD